jgi:hypothetical protein
VSVEQTLARAAKVNEKEGKCLAFSEHSLNIL